MPRVAINGISVHYRVEGDGPPLILQHGFIDSSESWYELGYVDALKAKYRVVLPDTRGHGRSDKPHDPRAYTPELFAADIITVLDDAGVDKVFFWGYSQGGTIALAMAKYAAERLAGLVIGGAAAAGSAYPSEPGKGDPLIDILRRGPGEVTKAFGEWLTPALEERLRANDAAALIACREQRLVTPSYSDIVGKIAVPTLMYAGNADPVHEPARQTASQIPGAQFISLPGQSHVAVMSQPDLILPQVREFLEEVY
jgi:pimeloyl-ACP methyl ester carboxylesterase